MTNCRLVLLFLISLFSQVAAAQPIPQDIKIGADFVWHLANSARLADVYAFRAAVVSKDEEVEKQVSTAYASVAKLRGSLVPSVDVIKQFYLERGEQRTIYRVQSKAKGSKFFEVHILGSNRPPMIIGIRELDIAKVVDLLAAKSMLSVPQNK